jgi:uncharacterized protein (TIGR02285 family)
LIWLLRDLPPLTIFEGPKKGQGVIDQLMPLLIAGMPQYEHTLMRVNRARGLQMLHENPFACDPALLWNKERAQWVAYSIPAIRAVSNGLVVRQQDRSVLEPYLVDGEVTCRRCWPLPTAKSGWLRSAVMANLSTTCCIKHPAPR